MNKLGIGSKTIAFAVVASALVLSFGIAQAMQDEVEAEVEAQLKLEQVTTTDVNVEVEAEGLASNTLFTVRAYKSDVLNCLRGGANAIFDFDVTSDGNGDFAISETILTRSTGNTPATVVVDDVGSVSIRSEGGPGANPPVVCFQNTTP